LVQEGVDALPQPDCAGSDPEGPCECGAAFERCVIASDRPEGSAPIWEDHPIVVDGWRCRPCGRLRYPAAMAPEAITAIGSKGAALAREGRLREAQWCFTRIVWDWPGWANGYIDLGQALVGRLDQEALDLVVERQLMRRAEESLERGITLAIAEGSADGRVATAQLTLTELLVKRGSHDAARRTIGECVANTPLSPQQRTRAEHLQAFIEEERWIFGEAADVIAPYMNLSDRPGAIVSRDRRPAIEQAIQTLEAHHEAHPSHWQSIFVAAMGRAALDGHLGALSLWRKAWAAHPSVPDIAREAAMALLRTENNEEALAINREATERTPSDGTLWCNRAVTEILCGNLDVARECLAKSHQLNPGDPIAAALERRLGQLNPNALPRSLAELEGRR